MTDKYEQELRTLAHLRSLARHDDIQNLVLIRIADQLKRLADFAEDAQRDQDGDQ